MKANKFLDNPKVPWGILAGSFAMLCSFLVVAVVAVWVISISMYASVGSDDGLRDSWWLMPIYIGVAVTFACTAFNLFCYIRRKVITAKIIKEKN